MAHPFQSHKQNKVEHSRVGHITKGYASGGAVHGDAAEDRKMVRSMVKGTALKMDGGKPKSRGDRQARKTGGRIKRAEGGSTPKPPEPKPVPIQPGTNEWLEGRIGRRQQGKATGGAIERARGGRTNAKKGTTNVNVIIAPQGGDKMPGLAGPVPGAPPMMPPKPPMPMMPPPGGAPGLPPGGPPPSIRHDGGRAYAKGGRVKRQEGGAVDTLNRWVARTKLRDAMGGKPPATSFTTQRSAESARDEMHGQMKRAEEHSDAVPRRASGGAVKSGPAWEEGRRNGTQVSHSGNKMDGKDVNRPKPVTYASGGPVEAPRKGGMGPKLSGGARGGIARLEKAARA